MFRSLTARGFADWQRLASTPLLAELLEEGKIIPTRLVEDVPLPVLEGPHQPAALLEHDRIPFTSYPYEWSFSMLRDAAVLQLELVRRSVEAGLMLKDASSYNMQWLGSQPVFIDIGSFEELRDGEPWAGYRQFCSLYLNPLLLQAYKNVPFQPWLRGSLEGISPATLRNLMSARDVFRAGVAMHVVLHSRLERRYAGTTRNLSRELKDAGFGRELILANVRRLERLLRRLEWRRPRSEWSTYETTTTYSEADADRKAAFVAQAVRSERPRLVWDLGCAGGHHARLAAEVADYVVALDADHVVADQLYEELRAEGVTKILPLCIDIVDASPALGWRGLERQSLEQRGTPDLTLSLALLHHVAITANVPVADFLDWLHGLGGSHVIEFPARDDPLVQRLLARKPRGDHADYEPEWFERCLSERFDVAQTEALSSGTRTLYLVRPKP